MSNYKKKIIRSKATANRIKSACSRFYRWAVVSGRIKYNPFSADVGVESFKEAVPDEIKIFSVQERKQIIENLDFLTAQEKMVVMLATSTTSRRWCRWTWYSIIHS